MTLTLVCPRCGAKLKYDATTDAVEALSQPTKMGPWVVAGLPSEDLGVTVSA